MNSDARDPTRIGERERLAREVIGAAIEVHRNLGPGYLESTYESAMAIELELRGVPFKRQVPFPLSYKGRPLGESRLDLVVGELVIVELKAVEALQAIHTAQALAYLRATGLDLALLINFNVRVLKDGVRRVVL